MNTFNQLGIDHKLCHKLTENYIKVPTAIQALTIPMILDHNDFVAEAATGSGKTLAFLLPIIQMIRNQGPIKALIISPTRELAMQIADIAKTYGDHLKTLCVYGGQDINNQLKKINNQVDLVVATPGRLIDHLERKTISLAQLDFLVFDEIDQLIEMGFQTDLDKILNHCPSKRQTLGFSATISKSVKKQAYKMMTQPTFVSTKTQEVIRDKVKHHLIVTSPRQKQNDLVTLLQEENPFLCIIFCRTRRRVDQLEESLHIKGFNCMKLHGGMPQSKRQKTLKAFRNLSIQYLVATEVASRGLDITGVTHVINYDMPESPESYVHRIGRTGRQDDHGQTYLFCNPEDQDMLEAIKTQLNLTFDREL